jgi:hypothetical protein
MGEFLMIGFLSLVGFFIVLAIMFYLMRDGIVKQAVDNFYEERNFKVKKELEMVGLFKTKFPNIKLYDLERNDYGEIIEESPLYLEIAKYLTKEMVLDDNNPDFDISDMFSKLLDKNSESYKTYVHIMRCVTNVNFESFIRKGLIYNFDGFNKKVMEEIEQHTDSVIVEVGTYIVEQIIEMMGVE